MLIYSGPHIKGEQHIFRFENGYGVSAIKNNENELWEVAILHIETGKPLRIVKDSHISEDGIIADIDDKELHKTMKIISELQPIGEWSATNDY